MKEKINFEGKKNSFIKKSLDILSLCGEVFGDVMKWKEKNFPLRINLFSTPNSISYGRAKIYGGNS